MVAEYIQIGQWIDIGGPVVDLVDLALLEVVVDVPELHFGSLRLGGAAKVTLAELPDLEIDLDGMQQLNGLFVNGMRHLPCRYTPVRMNT